MDKKDLQNILSEPFDFEKWKEVLSAVFGVKNFLQKFLSISLPSTDKAKEAFELGSFNTSDDRVIGLYLVKVNHSVWIERNKVGLRQLLRSVYKNDVDGALIVFEQEEKWRLSFVSEIRTVNEAGEAEIKITEPKRYTYVLGKGEKTKTPVMRLSSLAGKPLSLEDIRNAFSVEALNEDFYRIVAGYFTELVYEKVLKLPGSTHNSDKNEKTYKEFSVRLIGRIIFCWFLKVKKSDAGISLLPENLLSSEAVNKNKDYYHNILEKLFFQILNTPMKERVDTLPEGAKQIPFLNGGLFEPHIEDFYKPNEITGLSEHSNTLKIPDEWFRGFFTKLEEYNFTIDENSVVDIEVSVDPEMLGRIFENLLAEINPESGESARKSTGSYYTPREIVDYMATESLVQYLHNKTDLDKNALYPLFTIDGEVSFTYGSKTRILEALDSLKILDPACGSGAFPMGVLQKIVTALEKLDKNSIWWKAQQIRKIENSILRRQVTEKLDNATVGYARKIGIIQNSLYGVDIQPIAAEIAKLRCFLTLVVDENIDENKINRGIEPLPNLEFKFVTADTLSRLPEERDLGGLFNANDDLDKLQQLRINYMQCYGKEKAKIKKEFEKIQEKVTKEQLGLGKSLNTNSRAYKISKWNPFGNEESEWFDPLWMFGVEKFDIVIGNPPYVSAVSMGRTNEQKRYYKILYPEATGSYDLYILFLLRTLELSKGCYAWIIPNKFLISDYAMKTKEKLIGRGLKCSIDVSTFKVFKTANVYPIIIIGDVCAKSSLHQYKELMLENYSDLMIRQFKSPKVLKQHSTIESFNLTVRSGATGFEAQKLKKLISEDKKANSIPFVVSGNIGRYEFSDKDVRFMGTKYKKAYIHNNGEIAESKWEFWKSPKIVIAGMTKEIEAVFVEKPLALGVGVYAIYDWKNFNPKYVCAVLNSRYLSYYLVTKFKDKHLAGGYLAINKSTIEKLPLVKCNNEILFEIIVDYIIFIKNVYRENLTNISTNHLSQQFEELIDALVYELYFEEDFKKAGIEFMKYAERDFKSIEGLKTPEAKMEVINTAYNKLRERDNEIRQNLKLMDTRLRDLIMPIKSA